MVTEARPSTFVSLPVLFFFFCLNCDFLDKLLVFQNEFRDFPGGPVVKSLHFQFMGLVFDPWMGS